VRAKKSCWIGTIVVASMFIGGLRAADDAALTREQIKQFLVTAEVVGSKESREGKSHPRRLTLSNGTITHDASFQDIDVHKDSIQLETGVTVYDFVDSYKYNIAAYTLSEMLGIEDLLPVYVERKWKGQTGSLSWWLPVKMSEEERLSKHVEPPDPDVWNKQMYRMRVFDELIYDSDANLTNVLIGAEWHVWRIDFTRAFRAKTDLRKPANLVKCERRLFESLKELNGKDAEEKTRHYLTKDEVKAVMARRDKIVKHFEKMIQEHGEKEVLY
jgi:hypothetical protein